MFQVFTVMPRTQVCQPLNASCQVAPSAAPGPTKKTEKLLELPAIQQTQCGRRPGPLKMWSVSVSSGTSTFTVEWSVIGICGVSNNESDSSLTSCLFRISLIDQYERESIAESMRIMSCPSWQGHRTRSRWSPVRTLPVAPLWCDLGFFPNMSVLPSL